MAVKQVNNFDEHEMSHPQLRKTKICSFFQQGRCRYGGSCAFAHDMRELEAAPDLIKTSLCKHWVQGICPFSNADCRFAHGKCELRRVTSRAVQSRAGSRKADEELSAAVDAPGSKRFDSSPVALQTLSKAAPPGWLLPTPFKIDTRPDSPLTLPMFMDASSLPPPPGLEPMRVTPSFAIGSLGGTSPLPSPWKLQLRGQGDSWDSLPSTMWAADTEAGETSSDEEGSRSSAAFDGGFADGPWVLEERVLL
jgi:hypothetical protein